MLASLFATALVAYLAFLLLMFVFQGRMLYLPNLPGRELTATPADIGRQFETVEFDTDDAVTLHGWYVPAGDAPFTVIIFHGNAGNISHRLDTIRIWLALDVNVFIFDYRGYGLSAGRPSEPGTYRDARAAWAYLVGQRGLNANRIILFGRSLGGAVAAKLAGEVNPAGLIIESSFTSVPDIGAEVYPWLPVRWLSRFQYATRNHVGKVSCPVLVVHSRDDEIIGFHHGQAIYNAAREPKHFLELLGSHNNGFVLSAHRYRDGLAEFLETLRDSAETPQPEPF